MGADLRLALRALARSPGYAAVVVLTLALGIGATAALHSYLRGTLLRRYDFPESERLVRVESLFQGNAFTSQVFLPRYLAFRERTQTLVGVAGGVSDSLNLVFNGEPEGVTVSRVTANYFTVLGVGPLLGRTFVPADGEPGGDNVAVLTHSYWRSRFGGDPAVVGRRILLNERSYEVVGVLPEEFQPPPNTAYGRIYLPYVVPPVDTPQTAFLSIATIARLRPGVSRERAQSELRTFRPEEGRPYAEHMGKFQTVVSPIDAMPDYVGYQRYVILQWVGVVAVAFLYLIACLNAGSLMLVRMLSRRRDVGVRLALGAGRWAVVRPLFAEALVVSVVAVAGGVLVAKWLLPALLAVAPGAEDRPFRAIVLRWDTLGGLALLGLLTGVLVAAGPAWTAARMNLSAAMKDDSQGGGESRTMRRVRSLLVVAEAALAVALLAGTGLMIRTFQRLQEYDPGFAAANCFVVNVRISRNEELNAESRLERFKQAAQRLKAVPGVTAAGLMGLNFTPSFYSGQKLKLADRPELGEIEASGTIMGPDVPDLLGLPLRAGRPLSELRPGDPVAVVVSESFAQTYFPGRSPIGERIEFSPRDRWEIIGVVGDIRSARVEAKPRFYFPYWQQKGNTYFNLVVRTAVPPGPGFISEVRRALYEVEPKFAVMAVNDYAEQLRREISMERFVMTVLEVLGALALLLAMLGLSAMLAYSVGRRRAEFGIRFALGATPDSIRRLVVRGGLALAAVGVVAGLGLAWALSRLMRAVIHGTGLVDPLVFGSVGVLMLLAALPACWWPARRAGRVDVARLLRAE